MRKQFIIPLIICALFTVAYTTLSIIRHLHFGSFGYDLGIEDQITWKFSHLKLPISTISDTPFTLSFADHVELIYVLLAPFYLIWDSVYMLLILQSAIFCFSGMSMYLLAKKYKLQNAIVYAILIGYLMFYGVQNALLSDVHSTPFGAAFLGWFIYFLDRKKLKLSILAFLLTITTKENFPAYTFAVALVYFIIRKDRFSFSFMIGSLTYILFIFGIFFPFLVKGGYHYQSHSGLLSVSHPSFIFNNLRERNVVLYSLFSYGLLPLLYPITLIPFALNLLIYFELGQVIPATQDIYEQYRIELVPLLVFATILTIARYKWLNRKTIGIFLVICVLAMQYFLHLPLSYLTKKWFWRSSKIVDSINKVIKYIPANAAVVSQNNITPHISHRDNIFTLWPQHQRFFKNSPCGEQMCYWFSWAENPKYLIVDTSTDWDIRHLLMDRPYFLLGLKNLEKAGVVKKYKQIGTTILYRVIKSPASYR